MSKEIGFKNRDRFIQLGVTISVLRKMRGMSQEQLAAEAMMSRSHLSAIELLFNMLVLVGSVKMSDRIIREMMGL